MKVLDKSGKEVKDAKITFYGSGIPYCVTVKGINYDPSAFKLVDEEGKKVTKDTKKAKDSGVLTTGDLRKRKTA